MFARIDGRNFTKMKMAIILAAQKNIIKHLKAQK